MSRARRPAQIGALDLPDGWTVARASGPRPFVTRALLERPDGTTVEWSSRAHRKRLIADRAAAAIAAGVRPSRRSLWIGGLFMVGAFCFALGSMPLYFDHVSARLVGVTFFVGSIFFTSAAYLQYQEVLDAPSGVDADSPRPNGLPRFVALSPRRIDWWATAVQLVGTVFFNVSTFAAMTVSDDLIRETRLIWVPDVLGSICFLVASWFAFAEVGPRSWHRGERTLGWWIAGLNMLGSITFGVAAVAARYTTTTGEPANIALINLGTFIGAVCFFAGAALLPVESSREGRAGDAA